MAVPTPVWCKWCALTTEQSTMISGSSLKHSASVTLNHDSCGRIMSEITTRDLMSFPRLQRSDVAEELARRANAQRPEVTTTVVSEPFAGLESYYQRLFQQIKQRRRDNPPLGTGGDFDCLISMVEWLWAKYTEKAK